MRSRVSSALVGAVLGELFFIGAPEARAQEEASSPASIEEKTEGMERIDGFVPMYWDEAAGKIWLEFSRWDEEFLHYTALAAGVGSNDIGLDRGQLGPRWVVRLQRVGPKVLLVQPNYSYRAITDNALELKAVDDAFAQSVLWGFKVEAETDERVLVDATDYFLRDAHGVGNTLRRTNQGSYSLDGSRSAVYMERTKGFPLNTEVEVTLTFTGDNPGRWLRSVTPTASAVTVRQHYSFVQLPDDGYEPRAADPRAGYGATTYYDYATPIGEELEKRFIRRHRIEKRDPAADRSEPVEPIIYYLDPGTPEPVRSALLEGARWWNQAFEAAGFIDGFRVEIMPEGADPMDLRYNMIQWVHRSTRGWSYGSSVADPRTGEILKGHVSLGSLRVRQDYLLAEGLLSPYDNGDEIPAELSEMALARIRQLSAHEVGHTLGLSHNYISSAQGSDGRASVMDYPHPVARLGSNGRVELDGAYDVGIGEWDKVAIRYGYTDFEPGTDEEEAARGILTDAIDDGIWFITDQDARPAGSAHPQVHLWDNGTTAAAELDRMMEVRRVALDRFGDNAIRSGRPMATLEEALVPLYLHHRYQVGAAAKVVGGLYYTYALRGDGQEPLRTVSAREQNAALDAVLRTLQPDALAIPKDVLDILPPRPALYQPHRELFSRYTGLTFDAISPAVVSSGTTLSFLFHPQRAARMVEQAALDSSLPGLGEVIDRTVAATFGTAPDGGYEAELNRAVERVFVDQLMSLAARAPMPQVRAVASYKLTTLSTWLDESSEGATEGDRAHYAALAGDIERFLGRPFEPVSPPPQLGAPPGSPIGSAGGWNDPARWAVGPFDAFTMEPVFEGAGGAILYCSAWF